MNQEQYYSNVEDNELPIRIEITKTVELACDIIIKEFTNVFHHGQYILCEIIEMLLTDIKNYLLGKEEYMLSYSSKKAIDIIILEYNDVYTTIKAINYQLHINNSLPNKNITKVCKRSYNTDNTMKNDPTNNYKKHKVDYGQVEVSNQFEVLNLNSFNKRDLDIDNDDVCMKRNKII